MRFKDKVVVITGGGSGIGAAIAKRFAIEGALIVIGDINQKGALKIVSEIKEKGFRGHELKLDVSDRFSVDKFFDEVENKFGKIDVLINSAGVAFRESFLEVSEESWDKTIDINLKGTFLCSQKCANIMVKNNVEGKIVSISSICGAVADKFSFHAPYEASKAGINMLTRVMALELAPHKIRANAVAPGRINTPLTRKDPKHIESVISYIPLNRYGTSDEVASSVLFLSSEDSSYITGQILYVDGGWLVH